MEEGVVIRPGDQPQPGEADTEPDLVLIQVRIPDIRAEKCLQFSKEEKVWDVKQQILAAMPKELEDSFNYGLFQPPLNGRAGKFLDEERRLSEYPFQGNVGHLELKFKRRVYKMLNLDEKQLKNINSRSNLKKLLEHVMSNNVEKVTKMCTKGLDPNFHCQDSGETPLSLIAGIRSRPSRMVMALVNGGAILDFRTRDGSTAMHRAVTTNNIEAVRTMLELGASPNYRDSKNLSPLYHSCAAAATDPAITETLLHDHAHIGAQDLQGWQEVHQVCRNGMVHHLQHLLFYGADMNARNASGNTPLHVCAVNNQDSCAKMLLFRGADKECLNFAGQTAYQVAVIAGNLELAEVIQNHKAEDVVPFKDGPKYNPRRRVSASTGPALGRTMSDCGSLQYEALTTLRRGDSPLTGSYILKPASPSLSDRSLPPFSSGSSISETSTGSGTSQEEEQLDSASTLAAAIMDQDHHQADIISVSSGLGTSSNSTGSGGSGAGGGATPTQEAGLTLPGAGLTVVSLENYSQPGDPSHLKLAQGDVIQVTGSTDSGLLEGTLRGQAGYFPRHIVEEVRLRPAKQTSAQQQPGKHFGTTVRSAGGKIGLTIGHPRACVLHKGKKGFGFVLRGAKAASPLMDMIPSDRCPSLQYMDDVDPGGVADMAGVSKGDFLLAINGEDVTQASHERVVTLIRQSGDLVQLAVVTVTPEQLGSSATLPTSKQAPQHFSTLPRKPSSAGLSVRSPLQHPPPPPKRDPTTTLSVGRARAKSMVANMAAIDALDAAIKDNDLRGLGGAPAGNNAEVTNNNSNGNGVSPKIKNVAQELELIFKREAGLTAGPGALTKDKSSNDAAANMSTSANSSPALGGKKKVYNSVAQMKRSKKGNVDFNTNNIHKDYHSTPDLQTKSETENGHHHDAAPDLEQVNGKEPRRIHSQEDLHLLHLSSKDTEQGARSQSGSAHPAGYFTLPHKKAAPAVEDEFRTITRIRPLATPGAGPAPLHPPPPPPPQPALSPGKVVAVGGRGSDYAKVGRSHEAPVQSSFKPAASARLYAAPGSQEAANIGYKAPAAAQNSGSKSNGPQQQQQGETKKKSPTRTHSLPPRPTRPMVLKRIEEPETTETYSVNGVNYTTYTTFRSPITPDECDSVSNRFFSGQEDAAAETPTTPTNPAQEPHIPEPDYDLSDADPEAELADTRSCSGSESGSWRDTTATLRRNARNTTDRKKKKTVSFIMNEELANIIHSSGTMTKRDSILKDPSRERENMDECKGGRVKSTKRSPTKVAPPMPETPKTPSEPTFNSFFPSENGKPSGSSGKLGQAHPAWEGGSLVAPLTPPADSKLVSSAKIRIEVGNGKVPTNGSSTLPRGTSSTLQKSQSFSADLSPVSGYKAAAKSAPRADTSASSGGMISQADLQKAKLQLKSSRSFPELLEDGDNSSSGVSSDQDQDSVHIPCDHVTAATENNHVTQLTVTSGGAAARRQAQEMFECESNSSGQSEPGPRQVRAPRSVTMGGCPAGPVHIEWSSGQEEREQHHYQNFASMMQQQHGRSDPAPLGDHCVSVRRPFPAPGPETVQEMMSQSYHGHLDPAPARQQPALMTQSMVGPDSRQSIEHSLALIRHHVKGLNDVQVYNGVPPPPPSEPCPSLPSVCPAPGSLGAPPPQLAPPPGFSDSDSQHSMSDTDSLGSEPGRGFNRFGFSRVSKPRSLAQDRMMPQAQYTGGARKSASGILESAPVQGFAAGSIQKEFRAKSMPEWSVTDVCDWLDSLFLSEYKASFLQNSITGYHLARLETGDLATLGVSKTSHKLNIQKSIKRYLPKQ